MGCAAQRGAAYQLFTNKEGSVKPVENKNMSRLVIGVLVALVLLLGGYIAVSGTARGGKSAATANGSTGASEAAALPMETYQAQYVKPETPIDRSKNVTLPGWGGFTIPAKTKKITQGFEFHNPAENLWYVEKDRRPTPCSGL